MHPRIEPIEKPKGLITKIAFSILKRDYGKVIMPAKVIYARYPKIMFAVKKMYDVENSLKKINDEHKFLIQNFIATINGCTFCMDISMKRAIQNKMSLEKFYNLLNYQTSSHYSDKEKAILKYTEEATKNITVADETFNRLKVHCDENEIIEITFVTAFENYLNRMVKPLGIGSDELCAIR